MQHNVLDRTTGATMIDERLLTVEQVADALQIHPETVRRWLREGRLRGLNLGGKSGWRVRESALREYLESLEVKIAA